MTLQQSIGACESQAPNCPSAAETTPVGKAREQLKPLERMSHQTAGGQKHILNTSTSDEYCSSAGRTQRTGNKSSRHTDAVAKPVRDRAKVRSGGSRKSEVSQRPVRNDNIQKSTVSQPVGPMITRTIYTSDRRTRPGGDQTADRSALSNTAAVTVTTG